MNSDYSTRMAPSDERSGSIALGTIGFEWYVAVIAPPAGSYIKAPRAARVSPRGEMLQ